MDINFPLAYPLPATHPGSHLANYTTKALPPLEPRASGPEDPQRARSINAPREASGKPILHVRTSETHLHPRANELYLVSSTSCGQLRLQVTWDRNVFEPAVIEEWVGEIEAAAEWYLGQDTGEIKGKL